MSDAKPYDWHKPDCPFYGQPTGVPPDDRCTCGRYDPREDEFHIHDYGDAEYADVRAGRATCVECG